MKFTKYIILLSATILSSCFEEQEFAVVNEVSYIAISEDGTTALEGTDTEVDVTFIYSGPSLSQEISLPVTINEGLSNAVENVDYTLSVSPSSLAIASGAFSTSITINVLDNDLAVGPRILVFTLGSTPDIPGRFFG